MSVGTILLALTSHAKLGTTGRATGFYVSEAAYPWKVFTDAGYTVELVSVLGGEPPQDGEDRTDPVQLQFLTDPGISTGLLSTPRPEEIDATRYDAVLFTGGHGTMWDFPNSEPLAALARDIYEQGGVVGAVCHGPAALVNLTLSDGRYLVDGRAVAAFTDEEEAAVGLTDVVPFSLQRRLTERGARHSSGPAFEANVVSDGRLVTGQNPASATAVAAGMVAVLGTRSAPSDAITPSYASPLSDRSAPSDRTDRSAPSDRDARGITQSYFSAENRRDLEGILDHFADDVRFVTPEGETLIGRDGIRPFYAANLDGLPSLQVELVADLITEHRAALEWRAEGRTPNGDLVRMHGTNLVSVANGRFIEFHAYWCLTTAALNPTSVL